MSTFDKQLTNVVGDSQYNQIDTSLHRILAYDFLDDQTLASIARAILERSHDPQLRITDHSVVLPIITAGVCNACGSEQSNPQAKVCEACGLTFMLTLYIGY